MLKFQYQVVSLQEVLSFFAKEFTPTDGSKIIEAEHFVDIGKGVVVFKLLLKMEPQSSTAVAAGEN